MLFFSDVASRRTKGFGGFGRHPGRFSQDTSRVALDLGDLEDEVLVALAVHGKLACLAELHATFRVVALEWSLTCVDVDVLAQVLRQREALEAQDTNVALAVVRCQVSPQGETGGVGLLAARLAADERVLGHYEVRAL